MGITLRRGLTVDRTERDALRWVVGECPDLLVEAHTMAMLQPPSSHPGQPDFGGF